jgi:hypothetical protein
VDWDDGGNELACNDHPGMSNPGLPVPDPSGLAELDPAELVLPALPEGR